MKLRVLHICFLLCFAVEAHASSDIDKMSAEDQAHVVFSGYDVLIENVQLIDGTGAVPKQNVSVLVRDGIIEKVQPSAELLTPRNVKKIDGTGKTLLPGFVMVHEHMFYPAPKMGELNAYPYSFSRLYLAGGSTTVRTAGSIAPYGDINVAKAIAAGKQPGPDIDVTGPYLEASPVIAIKQAELEDVESIERTIDYWSSVGVTSFKVYNNLSYEQLQAAIRAAHNRGLKITGHLCSITYADAARLGIDNIEHGFAVAPDFVANKQADTCPAPQEVFGSLAALDPDGDELGKLIKLLIENNVALTSTLPVFEASTPGRPKTPDHALDLLTPELRQSYERIWERIQKSPSASDSLSRLMRMEKRFVEMGGTLLAGTDPTGYGGIIPGWSAVREVQLLIEAGFSISEAVKISTLNGARFLERGHLIGSVEPGKRADFILIDGNPVNDPHQLENIDYVFKEGIGFNAKSILEAMKGKIGLY
ncbi:amidohydrolase family protein [Kordiimonas pumila]|uniref:Amidohydrolase family protein n=1 Tax=Kordiimonas pumila TaxID=2161677 RepID=A0ABV7D3K4_9PROT|nr:amidohydrolase family protein [Kordiimonas pumila]